MAFDTAVSGIRAAAADLSIIGNNIANSSTTGFKASNAQFSDVFATSLLGSGTNSIGKGVALSNVQQEFAQGNISFTNSSLDLAINGAGFFVLSDEGAQVFSRAGSFNTDKDGFVVNDSGLRLQGIQATANGELVGQVGDITVDSSLITPQGTTEVVLTANLDSTNSIPLIPWAGPFDAFASPPTAPDPDMFNSSTSVTIYDEQGIGHVMSVFFVKSATLNEWEAYTLVDGVSVGGPDTIPFQANGQVDPTTLPLQINVTGWTPLDATGAPTGAPAQNFSIDVSRFTQLGANFSVSNVGQNGFTAGQLRGLEIDPGGVIFARYTNGQSRQVAQIMLANFTNQAGLQPTGDTAWSETFDSGAAIIGAAGNSGIGLLQSGALEESNVEITEQLVRMIVAQRNFQANAQVIQAEDSVTQSVINLR